MAPYQLSSVERDLVQTRLRLGVELRRRGDRAGAVAEWWAALQRDPENFTIRKQIWMAEHPERFHPTIDFAWQKTQLARERAEEIAAGICGLDGWLSFAKKSLATACEARNRSGAGKDRDLRLSVAGQ